MRRSISFGICLLVLINATFAFHVRKASLSSSHYSSRNSVGRLHSRQHLPYLSSSSPLALPTSHLPPHTISLNLQHYDNQDEKRAVPFILTPWIYLYRKLPKVYIPFTSLDVSFTIVSAIFLTCIDYTSAHILQSRGLPRPQTRKLAGSITTIFHSTCLVLGLGACLRTQPYRPSHKMDCHPDWWQDTAKALISFCTGYMIYDAAVQFLADRWQHGVGLVLSRVDWIFLGHHAATAAYMTSTRLIEAGHQSAMILMFFGELTAPIMNVLRITNILTEMDCKSTLLNLWRPVIQYLFSLSYVFFRLLVGPVSAVYLTYDLLLTKQGRTNVPIGLSFVWLTMVWVVLVGSWPWIQSSIRILQGFSAANIP